MPAENTRTCPKCSMAVPQGFPEGLCPKCLLTGGTPAEPPLPDDEAADIDRTLFVDAPTPSQLPRPAGIPSVEVLRRLFPDLEILDLLGAGGMGAVYKARQPRLNRLVALKIMVCPPGHAADFALRFEREAQVLARLNHPHIVTIYDFGDIPPERTGDDPLFYFLMEYVDGTDLGQLIKSKELKPAQALAIVPQICEALQYAHDQGITHRDVKPANILLDQRGTVKIADFGLAKMGGGSMEEAMMTGLTQTGTAMGTPHYMAPEQWEHPEQVDHRADLYALGVVFYEMLTGERPAGVFEPPSKRAKVDRKLDGVVMRAMEKDRDKRYQQASEINDAVSRLSVSRKSRQSAANGVPPNASKRSSPWIALSLMVLLGLGGFFFWPRVVSDSKDKQPPSSASAPWIHVDFAAADPANFVSGVEVEGQQLRLQHGAWYPAPDKRFKNVAQRVTLTWREDTDSLNLLFGPAASERPKYALNKHYAKINTTNFGNRYCEIGHLTTTATSLTGSAKPVDPPINPGDQVVLIFATIGDDHYVSLNGKLQHSVRSPLPASPAGYETVVSAYEALLDKYEYLPLDGLSEAEALNLLGLPTPPPPAKSAVGKGRLTGTGTMYYGKPVDLSRTAAYDDFVDVFVSNAYWVALRANGETISSHGMADYEDIRKIGRRFGGDPCFIDAAGKIHFLEGREKMELPAALQDGVVVDAVCGNDHGVALLENGEAVVFGRRYEEAMDESSGAIGTATPRWPLPPPAALQKVKALAALKTHAATLHDDGTVTAWGWEGTVAWEPEPKMKPVLQIAAAMDALRMLDADGQVWTFPLPRSTHPDQPVGFNGKLLLLDKEAVRLRDQVWQRKDGTWSGDKIDSRTMELLQSGRLEADAVFALVASTGPAGPFGYLLRVEPADAASTSR